MKYGTKSLLIIMGIQLLIGMHVLGQLNKDSISEKNKNPVIKSHADLLKYSKKINGLFDIYSYNSQYYFEIPDSLLQKELLVVTRIAMGASNSKSYSGDDVKNVVVRFEKVSSNRIILRKVIYSTYISDSSHNIFQAVVKENFFPIIASFSIEPFSPASGNSIINVTNFIQEDNEMFSVGPVLKETNQLGSILNDKSYIDSIVSYPLNVEIVAVKSYNQSLNTGPHGVGGVVISSVLSWELNTSIILLPAKPMQQRLADERVGYFSLGQMDYEGNPNGVKVRKYIKKWRLEPRKNDWDKYIRGELVEPEKPIVFYIDPATPEKYVPYLIKGVQDWNIAFENAGFKNAIMAKKAPSPADDPSWSLLDARHSVIVYKPSEIENASGPSIADPRSGEILESHIAWYHNVTQLIHDWFMVQCGAVDSNARNMIFSDSLMGQLVRFVISHEVGHTLGLLHNMGASSKYPVDSLRSNTWLTANGICPSIMDYARFNYVAQPEDHIDQMNLLPRIGKYDKWAIEWGYKLFSGFSLADSERHFINELVIKKTSDSFLQFGSENTSWDPSRQTEDLGNDAVVASSYGITNLKRILPNLTCWTYTPAEGYQNLNSLYNAVQTQFITYIKHVVSNISGVYENLKTADQPGPIYAPVSKGYQKECMSFLIKNVFTTPNWLLDTAILLRTGQTGLSVIGSLQESALRSLLFKPRLYSNVSRIESIFGKNSYTVKNMLDDLKKSVWSELYSNKPIDMYRRNLQKKYIRVIIEQVFMGTGLNTEVQIVLPTNGYTSLSGQEVLSLFWGHLKEIQQMITAYLHVATDEESKFHLQFIKEKIDGTFKIFNTFW
jgi:hypothetical protein